ncbi:MAG: Gfo/Idh/MocA family oxidoreductase [Clostridia bacterium]|nr:Gfo/Idh/MocA family oxidoreductase [Clostridia bacterium]
MDRTEKVKIGVLGGGRGLTIAQFCGQSDQAKLVAVCDNDLRCLNELKSHFGEGVAYYDDFDAFLNHDMDLVVLANYANAHAPFAIRALNAGKNVLSELLPFQTMKEACELADAIDKSKKLYIYGENCCFMGAPRKMRQLFRSGRMGTFRYGEGEYMHDLEKDWHRHSHSDPDHWRNTMTAFFYCTHSIGPLIHISGLRPVSVTGFEAPYTEKMRRMGAKGAPFGMEIITLENGALLKSVHGVGPAEYSLWYSCLGDKGKLESGRCILNEEGYNDIYVKAEPSADDKSIELDTADVDDALAKQAKGRSHGGADYYMMYNACEAVLGNPDADYIDFYEACDMFLPGMFAYFSVLDGNKPQAIPDLRDKAIRDHWRNDTRCTDPAVAGDQLLPSCSKGNPDIPQSVYDRLKEKLDKFYAEEAAKKEK